MTAPPDPSLIAALRASEERYRLLFESNPHPMWVYDLRTLAFLAVNNAAVEHYGYSRDEFLAMTIRDIRPQEDVPRLLENVARVTGGLDRARTWRHRRKDGTLIAVEITSHTLAFDGRPAELVLAHDVTSRLEAEQALRHSEAQLMQAQKMETVGLLAGGIAHDFNNLLTVINGYAEILQRRLGSDHPLQREVSEIRKAGERAAALTHQLLAFGRKQVLQPVVLDLNQVVAGMERMLRRLIGEDIELVAGLENGLWRVMADAGQIEQVIGNLVVNARDAMPKGGKLTLETSNVVLGKEFAKEHTGLVPGPHVMLAVADTGTGMSAETKARIFEPFFTTKPKGSGTGLGLSTVYGIVNQSGGHISVDSEPGRGTTFRVYFPRTEEPPGAEAAPAPSKRPAGSETILLVEDEDGVRNLVLGVLTELGYTLIPAADGQEGLLAARRHEGPVDLLITDVVMPLMGGRELAGRLAEVRPGIRVLYISGHTDDAIVRHGILESGTSFLQKPFSPDSLARKVREALDASPAPTAE